MSVGREERGDVARKVLSDYVFACSDVEGVSEAEIGRVLGEDFSVGDVRDNFFMNRNPDLYRQGRIRDLVIPFEISEVRGGGLIGALRKPFFIIPGQFGCRDFNPCSIRAAISREILRGIPYKGKGIIVACGISKTVADYITDEAELSRYDGLYEQASVAV